MKKQTIDSIYFSFSSVGVMSAFVLTISIVGYYSLNELGIKKYNGLFNALVPVALSEFVISVGVVNLIDYRSMRVKDRE